MEEVVHWRCALEGNILFSVPFLYTSWLPGGMPPSRLSTMVFLLYNLKATNPVDHMLNPWKA